MASAAFAVECENFESIQNLKNSRRINLAGILFAKKILFDAGKSFILTTPARLCYSSIDKVYITDAGCVSKDLWCNFSKGNADCQAV